MNVIRILSRDVGSWLRAIWANNPQAYHEDLNPRCPWHRDAIARNNPRGAGPVAEGVCRRCGGAGYAAEEDMPPPDHQCYSQGDPVACPECGGSGLERKKSEWE